MRSIGLCVALSALALGCGRAGTGGGHAHHEDRGDPAEPAAAPVHLDVAVDGAHVTWGDDELARVPHHAGENDRGAARDVWSLRDLAHQLVGPTARVVAIAGVDGEKTISAEAWADASRTPILHTTRRGTLKFRWSTPEGQWLEAEVKDVARLEIVR